MLLAIAASFFLLTAPALGDDLPWEQLHWHALHAGFSSSGGDFSLGQQWLESQLHTEDGYGFEYSRSLNLNLEKRLVFSIQGPIVGERAPGLAFEVRF